MNIFKRLFFTTINRFRMVPSAATIDKTGIIRSDHPVVGKGWIKGWVVNVPSRDIIIVCKHANPSISAPNNSVYVLDKFNKRITRTIVAVDSAPYKLDGKVLSDSPTDNADIAICRVNKPFPGSIAAYDFSEDEYVDASPVITFQKDNNPSEALVHTWKEKAWVRGMKRGSDELLWYGDSGTPWFVWEKDKWRVITHTKLGQWGEGPWYSHPYIYEEIKRRIGKLVNLP